MASSSRPSHHRGVCRYYSAPGGCLAAAKCKFLHGSDAILSPFDASKTCRYFKAGYCKNQFVQRGDTCWFPHVDSSSQPPVAAAATESQCEPELCAICFSEPTTYGLLEGCSHVFCRDCIKNWRGAKGKAVDLLLSGVNKACPVCRAPSRFITPSSKFHPNHDPAKEVIIQKYKASMAKVACRYFERSREGNRSCPYGKDCFYQHKNADGTLHVFTEGVDTLMAEYKSRLQARALAAQAPGLMEAIRAAAGSLLRDGSILDGSRDALGISDEEMSSLAALLHDRGVIDLRHLFGPSMNRSRVEHEANGMSEDEEEDYEGEENEEEELEQTVMFLEALRATQQRNSVDYFDLD